MVAPVVVVVMVPVGWAADEAGTRGDWGSGVVVRVRPLRREKVRWMAALMRLRLGAGSAVSLPSLVVGGSGL